MDTDETIDEIEIPRLLDGMRGAKAGLEALSDILNEFCEQNPSIDRHEKLFSFEDIQRMILAAHDSVKVV